MSPVLCVWCKGASEHPIQKHKIEAGLWHAADCGSQVGGASRAPRPAPVSGG